MLSRQVPLMLLAAACREPQVQAPPPPPSAVAAPAAVMGVIVGQNLTWGDALVRGDRDALGSVYAGNAVLMTATGDVTGRDSIVSLLMSARRARGDSIHGTAAATDQLDVAADRAYEAGTIVYTLISRGGSTRQVTARYVNFWQLEAGRWQLSRSLRPLP